MSFLKICFNYYYLSTALSLCLPKTRHKSMETYSSGPKTGDEFLGSGKLGITSPLSDGGLTSGSQSLYL